MNIFFRVFLYVCILTAAGVAPLAYADTYVNSPVVEDTLWPLEFSPYIVDDVTIVQGATLTIEPGVIVKVAKGKIAFDIEGELVAGSSTEPGRVVITSINDNTFGGTAAGSTGAPKAEDWLRIVVNQGASAQFYNTDIKYGAGKLAYVNTLIYNDGGSVAVRNSTLAFAPSGIIVQYGTTSSLVLEDSIVSSGPSFGYNPVHVGGGSAVVRRNTITANEGVGFWGSSLTFGDNTFSVKYHDQGNALYHFSSTPLINEGGNSGEGSIHINYGKGWQNDWSLPQDGLSYHFGADMVVPSGVHASIASGVRARVGNSIVVAGELQLGTQGASEEVLLTSMYDDAGMGREFSSKEPARGNWRGISVSPGGTLSAYASTIKYAGKDKDQNIIDECEYLLVELGVTDSQCEDEYWWKAAIRNDGGMVFLDDVTVAESVTNGIRTESGVTAITYSTSTDNTLSGVLTNGGDTNVAYSSLVNNGRYAIENTDETSALVATDNWYGDSSGPYEPSANPSGTGAEVSQNVSYNPWLSEPAPYGYTSGGGGGSSGEDSEMITLEEDTTWSLAESPYVLSSDVLIAEGATLTIEPGVVVKSARKQDGSLSGLYVYGTLQAIGSEQDKIYFTSAQDDLGGDSNDDGAESSPSAGDWLGIELYENGVAQLAYTHVQYAGVGISLYASTTSTIASSTFRANESSGLEHYEGVTNISHSNFLDNGTFGIHASGQGVVNVTGSTFANNTNGTLDIDTLSAVQVNESGNIGLNVPTFVTEYTIATSTVWTAAHSPYVLTESLTINQNATLTIEPGVIVKNGLDHTIDIYGTLNAVGTSDNKIYFTSLEDDIGGDTNNDSNQTLPAPGQWGGITVNYSGILRIIDAEVSYADVGIAQHGSSTISDNIIRSASNMGIIHESGTTTISGTSIVGESVSDMVALGEGEIRINSDFYNNGEFGFSTSISNINTDLKAYLVDDSDVILAEILGGVVTNDMVLPKINVPYLIDSLTIQEGSKLTVQPGTVIKALPSNINGAYTLFVNGVLSAVGTEQNKIYFTSFEDDVGGDTNNDGNATTPVENQWKGIRMYEDASSAVLNHAVVRHALVALYMADNPGVLTVRNSTFESNLWGMLGIQDDGDATIRNSNVVNDNALYGVNLYNNASSTVDARSNWWGSASGPYHATLNPDGTGNVVTGNVIFTPWLTAPATGDYVSESPATTTPPVATTTATTTPTCTENCYSNVLFLPGIMGSDLYKSDGTQCWVQDMNHIGDTDYDCVRMLDANTPNTAGVVTRGVAEYASNKPYEEIEASMAAWQTELGITATTTPYDWRYDFNHIVRSGTLTANGIDYNTEIANGTPGYIEAQLRSLASSSKTGKVTVVAHSMGGLVAKELMDKIGSADTANLVDQVILVATPQLGTPKAAGALLHGAGMALGPDYWTILTEAQARGLSKDMQGSYNLLPSNEYFASVSDPVLIMSTTTNRYMWTPGGDYIGATTLSGDSTLANRYGATVTSVSAQSGFMTDSSREAPTFSNVAIPEIANSTYTSRANTVHNSLDAWTPPAGVKLIAVAGWGLETFHQFTYARNVEESCDGGICTTTREYLTVSPDTTIDGDATVVVPSALYSSGSSNVERFWLDLNVPLKEHSDILAADSLRTLIKNKLTATNQSLPYIYTSAANLPATTTKRLQFVLHSPLTLGYRDINGNYTGLKEDGTVEYTIPGARYERFGEVQWLSVPADIGGGLEMVGTDDGIFTLEVREKHGNELKKQVNFAYVDTKKGMRVTLPFAQKEKKVQNVKMQNISEIDTETVTEYLEITVDRHDGKLERIQTREKKLKERKQDIREATTTPKVISPGVATTAPEAVTGIEESLVEETSSSTSDVPNQDMSTTTETVNLEEIATSTTPIETDRQGTSTLPVSSGLPHSILFLAYTLPLLRRRKIEISEIKKNLTIVLFLLSLPYIYISWKIYLSGIDMSFSWLLGIDRNLHPTLAETVEWTLMAPLIMFFSFVPFYFTSDKIYKIWLWWNAAHVIFLIVNVVGYNPHAFMFADIGFTFQYRLYVAGSLLLLCAGIILGIIHRFKKS